MDKNSILSRLPYSSPFLFVDEILEIDENSVSGKYNFSPELDFYKGHFKKEPVTPGVILAECMAQIGLVSLGMFLLNKQEPLSTEPKIALSSCDVEFLKPVYPGETVTVVSEKVYFRFNKLKCRVKMFDSGENNVCRGTISGMIVRNQNNG